MAEDLKYRNARVSRQRRATLVNNEKELLLKHIADLRSKRNSSNQAVVPSPDDAVISSHNKEGSTSGLQALDPFWPSLEQNDARYFENSADSSVSGTSLSFENAPKSRTIVHNDPNRQSFIADSEEHVAENLVTTPEDYGSRTANKYSLNTSREGQKRLGVQSSTSSMQPVLENGLEDFQSNSSRKNRDRMVNISTSAESSAILDELPPSVNMISSCDDTPGQTISKPIRRPILEKTAIAGRRRLCKIQLSEDSSELDGKSSETACVEYEKGAETLHDVLGRLSIKRTPLEELSFDGAENSLMGTCAEQRMKPPYSTAAGIHKSKAFEQKCVDVDSSSIRDNEGESDRNNYESDCNNCASSMPKANAYVCSKNDYPLEKFGRSYTYKAEQSLARRQPLPTCDDGELNDLTIAEDTVTEMRFRDGKKEFVLSNRITTMLYPHQREGVKWLWGLHIKPMGGILGDDMGLGKTMLVAAFLSGLFSSRSIKRALVVAPKTLIAHWIKELSVVGLQRKIKDYSGSAGSARDFSLQHVLQVGGILITTYDVVRHNWKALRGDYHGRDGFMDLSDDLLTWDYMVLDEGHLLKNPSTQRAKSLREIPSAHRIIISGTPIQNNLREMWALYDFCCPQLLGDRKEFKHQYEDLILRGNDKHATDRQKRIGSSVAQELRQRIAPFLLRRLKCEVFPDTDNSDRKLANKNDIIVWLRLSREQRQLYTAFLNSETAHQSLDGSALAALTVLKKICDHPLLLTKRAADDIAEGMESTDSTLDSGDAAAAEALTASLAIFLEAPEKSSSLDAESSCKIKFLMVLLGTLVKEGHRTLIFAQTRKMLNIVQEKIVLEGYSWCRIDGTMKASDREKYVQEFQHDNRISIFLLTSQVGGLGLTLTGADRVIIVDPAWNPSMDNQSVDRAYRIGQLKDVVVYRLMTCGTIEEKIYRKQVFKGGLMKVATEQKEQFRYFSQQELRELLTVPDTGFDVSMTQQQLYQEHESQCRIDEKLQQHIKFLETQGIAGVSYHDLLFSKEAPKLPPEENDEKSLAQDFRTGIHRMSNTQNLERFYEPTKLGKDSVLKKDSTNQICKETSEGDVEAQEAYEHVLQLRDSINRLSKTLADHIMISRLPDGGENIRKKLATLTIEHRDAEIKAASLKKKLVGPLSANGESVLSHSKEDSWDGNKVEICSSSTNSGLSYKKLDMSDSRRVQKGEKPYESSFTSTSIVQSDKCKDGRKTDAVIEINDDFQLDSVSNAMKKLQVID